MDLIVRFVCINIPTSCIAGAPFDLTESLRQLLDQWSKLLLDSESNRVFDSNGQFFRKLIHRCIRGEIEPVKTSVGFW